MRVAGVFAAALLLACPAAGAPQDEAPELPDPPEITSWSKWARVADGSYELEEAVRGRVALVHPKKRRASAHVRTIRRVCEVFDELLPREGAGGGVVVLVELEDPPALASVRAFLAAQRPYLAGWAQQGEKGVGFVVEDPLVGAWLRSVPGVDKKEWNPQNELTNRLTQLLLLERYGRMPQWLQLGLAWYLELSVCKDIYCFPYRSGFVGRKEHKGWGKKLAAQMAQRGESPIELSELTDWPRGTYDDEHAALAWGAGTLLGKYYSAELSAVVAALAEVYRTDGRETHADGSWEAKPGYEAPAARQLAILNEHLGDDFQVELTRFCAKGRSYVRPR